MLQCCNVYFSFVTHVFHAATRISKNHKIDMSYLRQCSLVHSLNDSTSHYPFYNKHTYYSLNLSNNLHKNNKVSIANIEKLFQQIKFAIDIISILFNTN